MPLLAYQSKHPHVPATAWVAPTAMVIGDVVLGAGVNVWFGAVLRGDVNHIRIGVGTNVQDNAVIHVTTGGLPTLVAEHATIGHGAILHACTVGTGALVGMGSTVLDGAVLEPASMLAAGALLAPGKVVPTGWLWAGVPAKPVRALTSAEMAHLQASGPHYVALARHYQSA
jgi:carbonic anhydrase/acetyltransferase-like protein (isoleucine patch superfamily)